MTDYRAVAASLRACTDPQKRHAADVIDALCIYADSRAQVLRRIKDVIDDDAQYMRAGLGEILYGDLCDAVSEIPADTKAEEYRRANPLGGPANFFHAIAERIEAGEDYDAVLRDMGVTVHSKFGDHPREATPEIFTSESGVHPIPVANALEQFQRGVTSGWVAPGPWIAVEEALPGTPDKHDFGDYSARVLVITKMPGFARSIAFGKLIRYPNSIEHGWTVEGWNGAVDVSHWMAIPAMADEVSRTGVKS